MLACVHTSCLHASPQGLCVDPWANLFVADRRNYAVKRIDAVSGVVGGSRSLLHGALKPGRMYGPSANPAHLTSLCPLACLRQYIAL